MRVVIVTMLSLLLAQCGGKVADLSFADSSELHVEVREKFDITVNVKNINMDNIDDDLNWRDRETASEDLQQKKMYITLKVVKDNTVQEIVASYSPIDKMYYASEIHEASVKNGLATFKGLYFTEVCSSNCQIIASLGIYGDYCYPSTGGEKKRHEYDYCNRAQLEPVDAINRVVVVSKNSYAAQVERLDGKNIKLTITKDDKPLTHASVKVNARGWCKHPPFEEGSCGLPTTNLIDALTVTLDENGSWSSELDPDGSWEKKVQEEERALSRGRDITDIYTLDVCKVMFDIIVDNHVFSDLLPIGSGCPQD